MSEVPTDEALVASVDVLPVAEGTSWTMLLVRLLMVAVSGLLTCPVTADEGGCHSATGPPDPQEEDSRGREGIQKRHRNAIPFNQRSPKRPPYSMPSATESPRGGRGGKEGTLSPSAGTGKVFLCGESGGDSFSGTTKWISGPLPRSPMATGCHRHPLRVSMSG